jgi:hypothetical protein
MGGGCAVAGGTGRAAGAGAGLQLGEQLKVEFLVDLGQFRQMTGVNAAVLSGA